jgi:nickel transport protein
MTTLRRLAPLILLAIWSSGAEAHRLKLFATLEEGTISGYAFFIGSGRAQDADLRITDASGKEVAALRTDAKGAYVWKAPHAQTYRLVANTGDGHVADATIDAKRFSGVATTNAEPANDDEDAPSSTVNAAQIERIVDAAVARQMRPLIEAYEAAEGRTRFNDVMGGIGMIIGLAGLSLWAQARRREKKP